jgi:heme exporter protein A
MDRPVIETRNLVKAYGMLPVLRGLNLTITRGEFVALLGPNGCGKSTLLRLLTGLSRPTAGEVFVGGWHIPREAAAVRAHIGMVGHKALLYEALTPRENLQFFARMYNLPAREREARIDHLLARVGLAHRDVDPVRTFSRGMQQRLSIARALLHNPDILLMDEPYTGLDQDASAMLDSVLQEAHAEGRTILMVTHELERAALLAKRAIILAYGEIAHDGPTLGLDAYQLSAEYAQAVSGRVAHAVEHASEVTA